MLVNLKCKIASPSLSKSQSGFAARPVQSLQNVADQMPARKCVETFVQAVWAPFAHEGNYKSAFRTLQLTDHIEGSAMQCQIYVMMELPDLGELLFTIRFNFK